MSPSQLVIAVFLFTLGFLMGRWALQRGPTLVGDHAQGQPMPAGYPRSRSMPAGFVRSRG